MILQTHLVLKPSLESWYWRFALQRAMFVGLPCQDLKTETYLDYAQESIARISIF